MFHFKKKIKGHPPLDKKNEEGQVHGLSLPGPHAPALVSVGLGR
jgi:hypothetical protein